MKQAPLLVALAGQAGARAQDPLPSWKSKTQETHN
jgi:hypothetical protein